MNRRRGLQLFFRGERQHHLRAAFSDPSPNGNELVALCAKRVDNLAATRKGLAAIAAAVVQLGTYCLCFSCLKTLSTISLAGMGLPSCRSSHPDRCAGRHQVSELLGNREVLRHFLAYSGW